MTSKHYHTERCSSPPPVASAWSQFKNTSSHRAGHCFSLKKKFLSVFMSDVRKKNKTTTVMDWRLAHDYRQTGSPWCLGSEKGHRRSTHFLWHKRTTRFPSGRRQFEFRFVTLDGPQRLSNTTEKRHDATGGQCEGRVCECVWDPPLPFNGGRQSEAWEGGAGPTWSSRVGSGSNTPAGDKHMKTWNSKLDRFNFRTFLWAPMFSSLQRTGNDRFLQIIPLVTLSVVNMMPCSPCCTQGSIRSSIRLTSDPRFLILMMTTKHWFLHVLFFF